MALTQAKMNQIRTLLFGRLALASDPEKIKKLVSLEIDPDVMSIVFNNMTDAQLTIVLDLLIDDFITLTSKSKTEGATRQNSYDQQMSDALKFKSN